MSPWEKTLQNVTSQWRLQDYKRHKPVNMWHQTNSRYFRPLTWVYKGILAKQILQLGEINVAPIIFNKKPFLRHAWVQADSLHVRLISHAVWDPHLNERQSKIRKQQGNKFGQVCVVKWIA